MESLYSFSTEKKFIVSFYFVRLHQLSIKSVIFFIVIRKYVIELFTTYININN